MVMVRIYDDSGARWITITYGTANAETRDLIEKALGPRVHG